MTRNKTTSTENIGKLAGAFCLALSLSACDTLMGTTDSQPCPPVSTLGDAEKITRFIEGTGRDLIDIDFTGRITHLSGRCSYEYDSDTGDGMLSLSVRPEFRIERGAANKTRQANFHYFVSILDDQGNVLDKQIFPYTAKYWKNRQSVEERDKPVELSIPLTGGKTGQDFNIYLGFQLTREELDFNRVDAIR